MHNGEHESSCDLQAFKNIFQEYISRDQDCEAVNQLWKKVWAEQAKLPAVFYLTLGS